MNLAKKKFFSVALTLNCDCRCKHCYIDSLEDGTSKDLNVDTWKNVLDDFHKNGGEEICIHGGEPLLYDKIDELLYYANVIGLKTSIISNLIHLSEKVIKALVTTSTYVLTSLDGPRDNYYHFRGTDKLNIITENISRLINENVKVHPIHIVHKKNYLDLSWIEDFCIDKDVPIVTLSPIQPVGRAESVKEYILSSEELYIVKNTIEELNKKHDGKVKFVTQCLYRPEDVKQYIEDERFLINYNDMYLNVLNDGNIIADFDLPNREKYFLGNVTRGIKQIDEKMYKDYKHLLARAYQEGLRKLHLGKSINWHEEFQRTASGK